jgi:hypothetical protein
MTFLSYGRKARQTLALLLIAPVLLLATLLAAISHPTDHNNGKFERPRGDSPPVALLPASGRTPKA